jgi:hypothetical protein
MHVSYCLLCSPRLHRTAGFAVRTVKRQSVGRSERQLIRMSYGNYI